MLEVADREYKITLINILEHKWKNRPRERTNGLYKHRYRNYNKESKVNTRNKKCCNGNEKCL